MKQMKDSDKSLQQMDIKQLVVNVRLNLEKVRSETRSVLNRSNENSKNINDLIIAMDGMHRNYLKSINNMQLQIDQLKEPLYKKIWNRVKCFLKK